MAVQHYSGGCQCGAVRYEADVDLDGRLNTCNCSRCQRLGMIWSFIAPDSFTLLSGDGRTTQWNFNRNAIDHFFCATCGVESFARGKLKDRTPMVALNVRCLEDVDIDALTPTRVDGRSF